MTNANVRKIGAMPSGRRAPAKVTFALPAYNEAKNLQPLCERIAEAMEHSGYDYQIVVVDDGSQDDTQAVLAQLAKHFPVRPLRHEKNQGLGPTLRDALRAAVEGANEHDIVVTMDGDNTHPPALVDLMARRLQEGFDVVIASRYQPGSQVIGLSRAREWMSVVASLLFRTAFPIRGVRDYTCGFRAYRAGALQGAFEQFGDRLVDQVGFQCMADVLLKLRLRGAVMGEVPMLLRYDFKLGDSKMRVARTVFRTLSLMVRRKLAPPR